MNEVVITVRPNGPYIVQGPVRVVDVDGREFPTDSSRPIALCRCGHSKERPFCDGAHKTIGFQADDRVKADKE